jgi:hypothetical protein
LLLVKIDFESSGSIIYFEKANLRLPALSIPSISSKAGFFSIFFFFSFFNVVPGNLNELSEGADSWLLWVSASICVVLVIWVLELDVVAWATFWFTVVAFVALVEVVD